MKYFSLIKLAWHDYDNSRKIKDITDISIKVSTNHVYRIILIDGSKIIAKVSDYGYISNFSEDHSIINALSINLPYPFENFLAKSLTKKGKLYIYEKKFNLSPVWVVFYNPIRTSKKPTKKQPTKARSRHTVNAKDTKIKTAQMKMKQLQKIKPSNLSPKDVKARNALIQQQK